MSTPSAPPATRRLFDGLQPQAPDALLALIGQFRDDTRSGKIDLGVGVYRDTAGATPVMRAIKAAEARLVADQPSKSYLGSEGDQRYTDLLAGIAFGDALAAERRLTGVQTPGGTGALRLGAELLALAGTAPTVWIGTPTWPNHAPIFRAAGLTVQTHPYFDAARSEIDFDAFLQALGDARPGDVVLLHGCCHNPTGTAFNADQWQALTALLVTRGLLPFVDIAYQGLGHGLDEDAAGMRALLAAVPEALVAYSCDKNFGLYRERVGALWALADSADGAARTRDNLLVLARGMWSMPPDHGAAAVRLVLEDPALRADWQAELTQMRTRINTLRQALGQAHPALAPIARQQGMFALLPIDRAAVTRLRQDHAIYMADSGRINIAGLREDTVAPFVAALAPLLPAR